MSYTDSQTGGPLQTNTQDYLAIALSANVSLAWPLEGLSGQTYVSSMIDVTPTGNSFSVSMPDAYGARIPTLSEFVKHTRLQLSQCPTSAGWK